jgi:hypothetical protein
MWQPNGSQVLNQRAWVTGALYSESDFESTTTAIYAVAFNYEKANNFLATTANDLKWNVYNVDYIYKYKGFSTNGQYSWSDRTPETGSKYNASGGFIQAGMLFSRRRFEVGFRRGSYEPNDTVDNNLVNETRGVFSYYFARHGLKWQTDFGQVEQQAGPGKPNPKLFEARSQLQFVF